MRGLRRERSAFEGNLIVVNAAHPYREERKPLLIPVGGSKILLERSAAVLLERLMAELDGWAHMVPVSGWRSLGQQQSIWDDSLRENGEDFTKKFVARPGCSEHQTGLAIDLGLRQEKVDFIRPDFPYTGICQAFRERAPRYGYVERYPAGKREITGIAQEPWHFRYVGVPHAQIMTGLGLTLEEYHDFLRQFPVGRPYRFRQGKREMEVSFLSGEEVPPERTDWVWTLSGNNADGCILTCWKEG